MGRKNRAEGNWQDKSAKNDIATELWDVAAEDVDTSIACMPESANKIKHVNLLM